MTHRSTVLACFAAIGAALPLVAQAPIRVDPGDARFPVLVHRTPYSRTESPTDPLVLAAVHRGYAVGLEDVRGRYGSGGVYEAYWQEGKDGYDTIEWAAHQPWSTGAVGTFGRSYPGAPVTTVPLPQGINRPLFHFSWVTSSMLFSRLSSQVFAIEA